MKENNSSRIFMRRLVVTGALLLIAQVFFSCASTGESSNQKSGYAKAPLLIVQASQESVYNGKALPFSYYYEGSDHPEVFYFLSQFAREAERGGTRDAPVQAGTYYVLVRCRYEEAISEYRIKRAPIQIEAEENQEAYYDGNPKRIQAFANPPVPLSYSYYPNEELRDAAIEAEAEAVLQGDAGQSISETYRGYRRIDRAPTEPGTYYVWIYFPGDKNHEASQMNVEFTIHPARLRY